MSVGRDQTGFPQMAEDLQKEVFLSEAEGRPRPESPACFSCGMRWSL